MTALDKPTAEPGCVRNLPEDLTRHVFRDLPHRPSVLCQDADSVRVPLLGMDVVSIVAHDLSDISRSSADPTELAGNSEVILQAPFVELEGIAGL